MPILAWTFSGKNTEIWTKNKVLIFVSYTLQDVIAISVLHHGLIYFLCTKSEYYNLVKKTSSFWMWGSIEIENNNNKITEVWYKDTNGVEKFIHVRDFYQTQPPLRQNRTEKITV